MAQLQKGVALNPGDTVEAADLNNLVDAATALGGFITDQTPEVSAVGTDKVMVNRAGVLHRALVSTLPGAGTVTSVSFDSGYPAPATVLTGSVEAGSAAAKIRLSFNNQGSNKVLAAPANGSTSDPGFRALVPRDMVIQTVDVAANNIDWSLGFTFMKTLTSPTHNLDFSNPRPGQRITVRLKNDGTARTVNWVQTIRWPAGVEHEMSTGANAHDLLDFWFIDGLYYGNYAKDMKA